MEFFFNPIAQDEALERVQKVSLKVILEPVYVNNQFVRSVLELEINLKDYERETLCIFCKKMHKISKALCSIPCRTSCSQPPATERRTIYCQLC